MTVDSLLGRNIFLVADSYWPSIGGVEQWAHSIASSLSKQCRVTIITHSRRGPLSPFSLAFIFGRPFKAYNDDAGNRVRPLKPFFGAQLCLFALLVWNLPLVRRLFPKRIFDFLYIFYKCAFMTNLTKMIADADLVQCFSTGYLGICATDASIKRSIPLIHSPAVHFGRWGDSLLLLRNYARAQAIICLSETLKKEFLLRLPETKSPVDVIPSPVFPFPSEKSPKFEVSWPFILFLGRREKYKGLPLFLSAFKKLTHKTCLVIAGPGEPLSSGEPGIIDAGVIDEPTKHWLLKHCAIFCLPSDSESFGIVYVEAMMHAKPIVALDIPPVNELVLDNETGLLVSPHHEDLLAEALDELLGDADKRRAMGEKGYKRYRDLFEGEKVMERIRRLYSEVMAV